MILTVEVESFDSESAFSTSLRVLSLGVLFLLLLDISFPFLAFLFGEDTFPTSHLGQRTLIRHTEVNVIVHYCELFFFFALFTVFFAAVAHMSSRN